MLWKSKSWTSGLVGALVQTVNKQFPQNGSKWMVSFHTKTSSRCVKPSETSLSLFLAEMLSKSDWTVIQIIRRTFARSAECILWLHIYIYIYMCIYIYQKVIGGQFQFTKCFFYQHQKKWNKHVIELRLNVVSKSGYPPFIKHAPWRFSQRQNLHG